MGNGKNGGAKGKRSVVVIGIGERMRSKSGRGGRPKHNRSTSSSPSITTTTTTTTSLPMLFNHKHNQVCYLIHIFVLFFYICLTLQFYDLSSLILFVRFSISYLVVFMLNSFLFNMLYNYVGMHYANPH